MKRVGRLRVVISPAIHSFESLSLKKMFEQVKILDNEMYKIETKQKIIITEQNNDDM